MCRQTMKLSAFYTFILLLCFVNGGKHLTDDGCEDEGGTLEDDVPFECTDDSELWNVRCCANSGRECPVVDDYATCTEFQNLNYDDAVLACEAYDMNICTHDQLIRQGLCCANGCGLDSARVWTRDRCDGVTDPYIHAGDYIAMEGCDIEYFRPQCTDPESIFAFRCCDSNGQTCESEYSGCPVGTQQEAVDFCIAEGKHLCTEVEIDSDVCCGMGCDFDSDMVWTSTSCECSQHLQACLTDEDCCSRTCGEIAAVDYYHVCLGIQCELNCADMPSTYCGTDQCGGQCDCDTGQFCIGSTDKCGVKLCSVTIGTISNGERTLISGYVEGGYGGVGAQILLACTGLYAITYTDSTREAVGVSAVSTCGTLGWGSPDAANAYCDLPILDLPLASGCSLLAKLATTDNSFQMFQVLISEHVANLDGSTSDVQIIDTFVTGVDVDAFLVTKSSIHGNEIEIEGNKQYLAAYTYADTPETTQYTNKVAETHCGCSQPDDVGDLFTFSMFNTGCFEIPEEYEALITVLTSDVSSDAAGQPLGMDTESGILGTVGQPLGMDTESGLLGTVGGANLNDDGILNGVENLLPNESNTEAVQGASTIGLMELLDGEDIPMVGFVTDEGCNHLMNTKKPICDDPASTHRVACCDDSSGTVVCYTQDLVSSGVCESSKTFAEAYDICYQKGYRLCTYTEMKLYPCCDQGCNTDEDRVWLADHCGAIPPPQCSEAVRADIDDLGFSTNANSGNDMIFGSRFSSDTSGISGECSGWVNFADAKIHCEEKGMRLCSARELTNDESGSGCNYDAQPNWTSTPCAAGSYWAYPGRALKMISDPIECLSELSTQAMASCCGDEKPHQTCLDCHVCSETSCEDFDYETVGGICTSDGYIDSCSGEVDFVSAVDYCDAYEMRLCELSELLMWGPVHVTGYDEGFGIPGSTCWQYGEKTLWSSSKCELTDGSIGFYSANIQDGVTTCVAINEADTYARCCADSTNSPFCCDPEDPQLFELSSNTNGQCGAICRSTFPTEDVIYASTYDSYCFCSLTQPGESRDRSECTFGCPGDSAYEFCGFDDSGSTRMSVYLANTAFNSMFLPSGYSYTGMLISNGVMRDILNDGKSTDQATLAKSGAPRDLQCEQLSGGDIRLSWVDASSCESRFEYYRDDSVHYDWRNPYSFDLNVETIVKCGHFHSTKIRETVVSSYDDESNELRFNTEYILCLRTNTEQLVNRYVEKSAICISCLTRWEATLKGVVESLSGFPVSDVTITACSGAYCEVTTTDNSGRYSVRLHGNYDDIEQEFQVTPAYTYQGIVHQFKCGSQQRKCTSIAHKLRLDTDLDIVEKAQQTLDFVDTTVADIAGTVSVQEPMDASNLCPQEDTKVCFHFVDPYKPLDEDVECALTDENGRYNIQIPMQNSVTASLQITRNDAEYTHDYENAYDDTLDHYYYDGVDFDHAFPDQDFYEVTSYDVSVDVFGGTFNCNLDILKWVVRIIPHNCAGDDHHRLIDYLDGDGMAQVAAQAYIFILDVDLSEELHDQSNFDMQDVENYFLDIQNTINMTDIEIGTTEEVSFEFHVPATIAMTISGADTSCENTEGFVALDMGTSYETEITFTEEYTTDILNRVECDDVEGETFAFGMPQMDLPAPADNPPEGCASASDAYSCIFSAYNGSVNINLVPAIPTISIYQFAIKFASVILNPEMFIYSDIFIKHIYVLGKRAISPGLQVPLPEHWPLFILREGPGDWSESQMDTQTSVIVEVKLGETDSDGESMKASGGLGIEADATVGWWPAYIKAVKTSTFLGAHYSQNIEYITSWSGAIVLNIDMEEGYTTQGGRGAFHGEHNTFAAKQETDMFLTPAFNIEVNMANVFGLNSQSCAQTVNQQFTWTLPDELRTALDSGEAASSDMFSWYSEYHIRNTKVPELEDMLSSHNTTCPTTCENYTTSSNDWLDCNSDCAYEFVALYDALEGWENLLDFNDKLKVNAKKLSNEDRRRLEMENFFETKTSEDTIERTFGRKKGDVLNSGCTELCTNCNFGEDTSVSIQSKAAAFDICLLDKRCEGISIKNDGGSYRYITHRTFHNQHTLDSYTTYLCPYCPSPGKVDNMGRCLRELDNQVTKRFLQPNNVVTENTIDQIDSQYEYTDPFRGDMTEYNNINQITFSGGGSSYSVSYVQSEMTHYVYTLGGSFSSTLGFDLESKTVVAGIGVKFGGDKSDNGGLEQDRGHTYSKAAGFSSTYIFQDDDIGDDFTVEMLVDSMGWPVFNTVGGRSSCPRENGTIYRQVLSMKVDISKGDLQHLTDIDPNESVRWAIEFLNESPFKDMIDASLEIQNNTGGLITAVNGNADLETGGYHFYHYPAFETHVIYVTGTRPPGSLDSFDLQFRLFSNCEPSLEEFLDVSVVFTAECPPPTFDMSAPFLVVAGQSVVKITVANPDYRMRPWMAEKAGAPYKYARAGLLDAEDCPVFGSITTVNGTEVVAYCEDSCSGPTTPCGSDPNSYDQFSDICAAYVASSMTNEYGDFLFQLVNDCYIIYDTPDNQIEVNVEYRALSAFGTQAWEDVRVKDTINRYNFARFSHIVNGRVTYEWEPPIVGAMELRALARCGGGFVPTTSPAYAEETVLGFIDTTPPEQVPFSEPSDNIYDYKDNGRQDEVSFQFNEPIFCSSNSSFVQGCEGDAEGGSCTGSVFDVDFYCPNDGGDGKIIVVFDGDTVLQNIGAWYSAWVTNVEDQHANVNTDTFYSVFLVQYSQLILLVKEESPHFSLLSVDERISVNLSELDVVMASGSLLDWSSEGYLHLNGEAKYSEVSFDVGPSLSSFESSSCTIEYSLFHPDGSASCDDLIVFNTPSEGTLSTGSLCNEQQMSYGFEVSCDINLLGVRFTSADDDASLHPSLVTTIQISSNDVDKQLAHYLDISEDRIMSRNPETDEFDNRWKVFEITKQADDLKIRESTEKLNAMGYMHVGQSGLLENELANNVQLKIVEKVCDGTHSRYDVPHFSFSESWISNGRIFMTIHASLEFTRLSFAFQDAVTPSGIFEFNSKMITPFSSSWSVGLFSRCVREFTFDIPLRFAMENDVMGLNDLSDGEGNHFEGVLNVDTWRADKQELFELPFQFHLQHSKYDLSKIQQDTADQLPESLKLLDIKHHFLSVDVEFISNTMKDTFRLDPKIIPDRFTHFEVAHSIAITRTSTLCGTQEEIPLRDPKETISFLQESSGCKTSWNVHIELQKCEPKPVEFQLVMTLNNRETIRGDFAIQVLDTCGQIIGSPCSTPLVVENSAASKVDLCSGKLSGSVCEVECLTGYTPSSQRTTCTNGVWVPEVTCQQTMFLTSPGSFLRTWRECSERGGHLASIHSEEENKIALELCAADGDSPVCYIGAIVSQESYEWIDGSEMSYKPSTLVNKNLNSAQVNGIPLTAHVHVPVHIHGKTGAWAEAQQNGHKILPAICELGDCIPLTPYFVEETPDFSSIETPEDSGFLAVPEYVLVSDGCTEWFIVPTDTFDARNTNTIHRTWVADYLQEDVDVSTEMPRKHLIITVV